ncbi:MAG: M23 family metallopeptidase [Deltaproteobacteria bacterium]|nr:M23 family metallopeptidase [Deltaproteobacteria bacterium]
MLTLLVALLSQAPSEAPPVCSDVRPPLGSDRVTYEKFHKSVISVFGADRQSYVRGHRHAGIDIRGRSGERVRPICVGRVVDIHLDFPHRTIVVEHVDEAGSRFYSSYKHVEDVAVEVGDLVQPDDSLARLFVESERKRASFQVTHLHFELRHSIEDGGVASWTAMSMEELQKYADDPLPFFRRHLTNLR